jgi:ABC-2 type transport system permease protein
MLGYFISYAYVLFLFTNVPLMPLFVSLVYYLIWVLFIVSFTTMISAIFNSQGMIALVSIVFLLGCRIIAGLHPAIDYLNPASMSNYATKLLVTGTFETTTLWSLLSTVFWLFLTIWITNRWISKKKFHAE